MHILHVTPTYVPAWRYGGPIRSVHGLARAQAALGHDVTVFTTNLDGPYDLDVPLDRVVDLDGVKVRYFPVASWLRGLARRLAIAPALDQALIREARNFDIVHTHSTYLWPTTAAARAARRAGRPYVMSPRGMLWPEMIRQRATLRKRAWIALFERRNVEKAAAIHVTAPLEAAKIAALGLGARGYITLPNGVDPASSLNLTLSHDVETVIARPGYVLTLGRIDWKKNNEALIDALAERPLLHAVIAGNDEDGHAERLLERARHRGVAERIAIIARHVDGSDKEALFAGAAIFALPSHSENFGNTVLEAMVRGVPVLASEQTGAAEVVRDAGAGLTCCTDDMSVGRALDTMLSDPAALARMGEAGRRHAAEHFGWPGIAAAMTENYREIVG